MLSLQYGFVVGWSAWGIQPPMLPMSSTGTNPTMAESLAESSVFVGAGQGVYRRACILAVGLQVSNAYFGGQRISIGPTSGYLERQGSCRCMVTSRSLFQSRNSEDRRDCKPNVATSKVGQRGRHSPTTPAPFRTPI